MLAFLQNPYTLILTGLLLAACGTKPGDGELKDEDLSAQHLQVMDYVDELDAMRSGLAQTIGDAQPDRATFQAVCKPVGERARQLSEETGWTVRQLAVKYRNPDNKADELAAQLIERFEEAPELQNVWERGYRDEEPGWRYFQKIQVEPSCLACHGDRDARPSFVVDAYPEDRAYGFSAGDVRGVYSVFVPDSSIP